MEINIYVSTCDLTIYAVDVFQHLFNKNWSANQKVTILGYSEPSFELPSNFDFISMGEKQIDIELLGVTIRGYTDFEFLNEQKFRRGRLENEFEDYKRRNKCEGV